MSNPKNDYHWPDARDELAEIVANTTPSQRLEWLDEMLDLAYASGALERARVLEDSERVNNANIEKLEVIAKRTEK